MLILEINDKNFDYVITKASEVIKSGGIVIYPTETCYGVGVNALDEKAVEKLIKYKNRPQGKAISVAVKDRTMAEELVELSQAADNIYNNFLPGPVTVVSKSRGKVAKALESAEGKLGIRIPDHKIPTAIIEKSGLPITATSANLSSNPNPYSVGDILKYLTKEKEDMIGLIINAGVLPQREPSTVVDTTLADLEIIRKGNILFDKKVDEFVVKNFDDLKKVANSIVEIIDNTDKNIVFMLSGKMGAGKTTLIKEIALKLNIKEELSSPTYTIFNEYEFGGKKLIHMDLWKVEDESMFKILKFDQLVNVNKLIFIEWADKFKDKILEFSQNNLVYGIDINLKEDERTISITQL